MSGVSSSQRGASDPPDGQRAPCLADGNTPAGHRFHESAETQAKREALQRLNPLNDRQAFDDAFGEYLEALMRDRAS